jgi:putative membrane protein
LLALAALTLAACAQSVSVHTVADSSAQFDRYRTFSFGFLEGPPPGYASSPWSGEARRRIEPVLAAALMEKGYRPASGKGDLIVGFGSGRRVTRIREATPPEGQQSVTQTPHFDYQELDGALVVDMFDAGSGVRVWHGSSRVELDPDRADSPLLERSVKALLATFPTAPPRVPVEAPSPGSPVPASDGSVHAEPVTLTSATLSLADAAPPAPVEANLDDGQVAMIAYDLDTAEIEVAKLALLRTKSAGVRGFAERILRAHTLDEQRLSALASAAGILPKGSHAGTKLSGDGRAVEQALMGQFDSDFDREYVVAEIQMHHRALDVIDGELLPNAKNPRLKAAVNSTRTELVGETATAEALRESEPEAPSDTTIGPSE